MAKKKPLENATRKPTVKQRKYVAGVMAGKSKKQAARDAGYSAVTAVTHTPEIDASPAVQSLIARVFEKAGVSDELLARRVYQGLHAMETKFFQKDGEVTDKRNVVNWGTRHESVVLALKLKGHLHDKIDINASIGLADLLTQVERA